LVRREIEQDDTIESYQPKLFNNRPSQEAIKTKLYQSNDATLQSTKLKISWPSSLSDLNDRVNNKLSEQNLKFSDNFMISDDLNTQESDKGKERNYESSSFHHQSNPTKLSQYYHHSARSHRQLREAGNIDSHGQRNSGENIIATLTNLKRQIRSFDLGLGKLLHHKDDNSSHEISHNTSHSKTGLTGFLSGLGDALDKGLDTIGKSVESALNETHDSLHTLADTLEKPFEHNTTDSEESNSTHKSSLLNFGQGLLDKLSDAGEKIGDQILDTINKTQQQVHGIVENIGDPLKGIFNISHSSDNNNTFTSFFSDLTKGLLNTTSELSKAIVDAGGSLGDTIGATLNNTKQQLQNIGDIIEKPLNELASGIGIHTSGVTQEPPAAYDSGFKCEARDWMSIILIAIVTTISQPLYSSDD